MIILISAAFIIGVVVGFVAAQSKTYKTHESKYPFL